MSLAPSSHNLDEEEQAYLQKVSKNLPYGVETVYLKKKAYNLKEVIIGKTAIYPVFYYMGFFWLCALFYIGMRFWIEDGIYYLMPISSLLLGIVFFSYLKQPKEITFDSSGFLTIRNSFETQSFQLQDCSEVRCNMIRSRRRNMPGRLIFSFPDRKKISLNCNNGYYSKTYHAFIPGYYFESTLYKLVKEKNFQLERNFHSFWQIYWKAVRK